jgi:hypothetical protein
MGPLAFVFADHMQFPEGRERKKLLRSALHHRQVDAGQYEPRTGPSAAQLAGQD